MARYNVWVAAVAVSLASVAMPAVASPFTTLGMVASTYNAFLLGDLGSASNAFHSDSIGAVVVRGNAYISNASIDSGKYGAASLIVGGNLVSNGGSDNGNVFVGGNATFNPVTAYGNLVVGGNLTATGGTVSGNVFAGGSGTFSGGATISGSVSVKGSNLTFGAASTPNGFYVSQTTSVNVPSYMSSAVHTSGGPATPAPPLDVYGTATDIVNASAQLAALTATSVSSSGGTLNLVLTKNGLNVINLTLPNGATVTGLNITTANGVTPTGLILNVNGNNISFNGGSFNLGALSQNNVLFNFYNATSLSLSSLAFEGTLLAAGATVNFNSGNIDGALIANNYLGSGELHEYAFNASLLAGLSVAAISEPGSAALLWVGMGGLMFLRRRLAARSQLLAAA